MRKQEATSTRPPVSAKEVAPRWLLKAWGYLAPHGRNNLVAPWAVSQGYGRNLHGKPLLFADRVNEVLRTVRWGGIQKHAGDIQDTQERLHWLLRHHPYIPDAVLAVMTGYNPEGIRLARKRAQVPVRVAKAVAKAALFRPDDLEPVF